MEGHIYIYGEITSEQGEDAKVYGYVNPRDVLSQIQANASATSLTVHINSIGGSVDAGFSIYDILKTSGKQITTMIEGQCYSIATVIAMAGKKRLATSNSEFLIHFPMSGTQGRAEDFEKLATQLRKLEKKAAKFYSNNANISQRDAMAEMAKDDFMTLEQAMQYGFITEIIDTNKAVAKVTFNNNDMSDKSDKGFWAKFKEEMKSVFDENQEEGKGDEPKNIILKSATGIDIVFPERNEGNIQKGDEATMEGEPAKGEVLMANGDTLVFEGGKVTAINEKEEVDIAAIVASAVAKAIEPINEKLTALETQNETFNTEMVKREKVFNSLKNIVSNHSVDNTENTKKTSDKTSDEPKNILSPLNFN